MDQNNLEQLRKRLYKGEESFKERKRKEAVIKKEAKDKVPEEWEKISFESPEEIAIASKAMEEYVLKKKKRNRLLLFGTITVLLIATIALLGYDFYIKGGGIGFLSSKNIEINVLGPKSVKAGEKTKWNIKIKNLNKVVLENAILTIEYPRGAVPINILGADSQAQTERRTLGEIEVNEERMESFEAFFFGEENEEQKINISLEYRLKDSSAIFEKSYTEKITISKPAIIVSIDAPSEIALEKELDFKISVVSNTEMVMKNLAVDIDYPEGFEIIKATPSYSPENKSRWKIGDLAGNETKIIDVIGKFSGGAAEVEKNINVKVGALAANGEFSLYSQKTSSLFVKKPFLDISSKVNGEENYISQKGNQLNVVIKWSNNLPVGIKNAIIETKLTDIKNIVDLSSLTVRNGDYRSFDKTIVWKSSTFPKFAYIESGEEGEVSFSVKIKSLLPTEEDSRNFSFDIESKFYTEHVPEEYRNIEIVGNDKKTVRLTSEFEFTQRGLFYSGPFKNTGPIPPKLGKETTYTIVWSIANSSNDLSNIEISATIPNYVKWLNKISPESKSSQIYFDAENGKIIWKISNLKAGAGFTGPAEEIAFQISFLPSESQTGKTPILLSSATAKAYDSFAGVNLKSAKSEINTDLSEDSEFPRNGANVTK